MPKRKKSQQEQQEQQQRHQHHQHQQEHQQQQSPLPPISSAAPLSLHSLPDLALGMIVSFMEFFSELHGLQLTDHFCLKAFAEHVAGVFISCTPVLDDPPPSCNTTRSYAAWLNKHATVLSSFLSRFPRFTDLGGDAEYKALVDVLQEVFRRKSFPNIEWCNRDFFCSMPLRILATSLPNLEGLAFTNYGFLGDNLKDTDAFFEEFAAGMFKRLKTIEISVTGATEQRKIMRKLTAALRARETAGTFPSLVQLTVTGCDDLNGLRQLLMLDSCSKLSTLHCFPAHKRNAPELLTILASHMRRTLCTALEVITIQPSLDTTKVLGDVSDVLMTGMATELKHIAGMRFYREAMEELIRLVGAGVLPDLERLDIRCLILDIMIVPLLTTDTIAPLIKWISVHRRRLPTREVWLLFLQAVADESFPNLETLNIDAADEEMLQEFVAMLKGRQETWVPREKTLFVFSDVSAETSQELSVFFPSVQTR